MGLHLSGGGGCFTLSMREASGEEEQESAVGWFPFRVDTGCGAESRPCTGASGAQETPKAGTNV